MSCRIDGNSIKRGMESLLEKQLASTGIFTKQGNNFVVSDAQYFGAQQFVNDINSEFGAEVIKRLSDKSFSISIPDDLLKEYVVQTKDGEEASSLVGLYNSFQIAPNSMNSGEMFTYLNYPEITEMTNDKLKEFLLSLNPNFKVEEIDNLSVKGVAYVKDFLIRVRTMSKFKVMPEEVAHIFRMMLPDNHPLKQEMFNNITSFPIYSTVLAHYKNIYKKEDGTPDYDKIKWEAADKLVAEFVTAIATGDNSRIEALGKTKQNFIQRWFAKLLKWLGISMKDKTRAYADIAGIILSGENTEKLKTKEEIANISFTDSYFFNASEEELYDRAYEISLHPPTDLLAIITKFANEYGKSLNTILKDERFEALNNELKKLKGNEIGQINHMIDIKNLLKDAKIGLKDAVGTDGFLIGLKQALEAIDRLSMLSKGLLTVLRDKTKAAKLDEAIKNISELESYMGLYETFVNIISKDLADALMQSGVGADVVRTVLDTKTEFDTVTKYIINKQRENFVTFFSQMLAPSQAEAMIKLKDRLKRAQDSGQSNLIEMVKKQMRDLIVTEEQIEQMLSGKGVDIDKLNVINHLFNAAVLNGDPYVASIAMYITDKLNRAHQPAKIEVRELLTKIDAIQKQLGEIASVTGSFIVYADTIPDSQAEGGTRQVLKYLNPWKGIELAKSQYADKIRDTYEVFKNVDVNDIPAHDAAFAAYKKAKDEYQDFLEKYMNRPYIREYYDVRKKYDNDPNYVRVMEKWNEKSRQISQLEEQLEKDFGADDLWDELAMLKRERGRLLHEYDDNGDLKTGNLLAEAKVLKAFFDESSKFKEEDEVQSLLSYSIAENRYSQKIDFALQEVRKEKLKDIYDIQERVKKLMHDNNIRFADLYNMIEEGKESEVKDYNYDFEEGVINYDFIKDVIMEKWYNRNNTIVPSEAYYEEEKSIIADINALKDSGQLSEAEMNLADAYLERRKILAGSRDNINQVNPASLTEQERDDLVELDAYIEEQKKAKPRAGIDITAMSQEHRAKYEELKAILADPATKGSERLARAKQKRKLEDMYRNAGKNKVINDLWSLLGSMSDRIPTQYYWDKMEEIIPHFSEYIREALTLQLKDDPKEDAREKRKLIEFEKDFVFAIDEQDWQKFDFHILTSDIFGEFVDYLKQFKPSLYDWFTDNHSEGKVYDPENNKPSFHPFVRSTLYNQKVPTLPEHQKLIRNRRFKRMKVKDEYKTGYNPVTKQVELKVGVHISNRETTNGYQEFLPLSPEQGEPVNSPYRNQAYYDLRDTKDTQSQLRFKYMELLKESHLKSQERIPAKLRRWMEVPVMNLSHIESIKHVPTVAQQQFDKIKAIWNKNVAGTAQFEVEGVDTVTNEDTQVETENEEGEVIDRKVKNIMQNIPKVGMSQKLPIDAVSKDLLKAQEEFIIKTHEFSARSEAQAIPKALNRVMQDNAYNLSQTKAGDSNIERAKIFEKIYKQMILEEVPDGALNNQKIRRVASFLTGNTALRMLADLPGAAVNYVSAMVNTVVEAAAGKYLTMRELVKGKQLAFKVDMALAADFNKKTNLSYYTMLFIDMDLLQGDFAEDLLDRSSSTDKWSSVKQIMMIPRKSGELFVQTAVGMGMMERYKVKNEIDGQMYPFHEIFKKDGDRLVLKEGFYTDVTNEDGTVTRTYPYNPLDGDLFHKMKNKINRLNLGLHGNYAKISQTEASRYAIGKLAENMKRWFMPAFTRRFGRTSVDIIFEDLDEGYYRTAAVAAYNYFKALFQLDFKGAKSVSDFYLKDPDYRQNLQRAGAEAVQSLILFLTFALLLGYNGKDKNKELEHNSWIHNMAILVALRAYSETTAYIPVPPWGFQEMKRNVLSPFALPADAVSNFAAMAELGVYQVLYWFGDKSLEGQLYYQNNSGGYWYTKQGHSKFAKYLLRSIGFTGYTFQPAPYIKTFQNLQQRLK